MVSIYQTASYCVLISDAFKSSEDALARFIVARANTKPHLADCIGKESATRQMVLP
jgi:hypothetical protein